MDGYFVTSVSIGVPALITYWLYSKRRDYCKVLEVCISLVALIVLHGGADGRNRTKFTYLLLFELTKANKTRVLGLRYTTLHRPRFSGAILRIAHLWLYYTDPNSTVPKAQPKPRFSNISNILSFYFIFIISKNIMQLRNDKEAKTTNS